MFAPIQNGRTPSTAFGRSRSVAGGPVCVKTEEQEKMNINRVASTIFFLPASMKKFQFINLTLLLHSPSVSNEEMGVRSFDPCFYFYFLFILSRAIFYYLQVFFQSCYVVWRGWQTSSFLLTFSCQLNRALLCLEIRRVSVLKYKTKGMLLSSQYGAHLYTRKICLVFHPQLYRCYKIFSHGCQNF